MSTTCSTVPMVCAALRSEHLPDTHQTLHDGQHDQSGPDDVPAVSSRAAGFVPSTARPARYCRKLV